MLRKLLVLALCFFSALAYADTFNFSYSGTDWDGSGTTVSASGTLTTDAFNGSYYQITGITGERNGVAITALGNLGDADNELFLTNPAFDPYGLGYEAGGVEYNLYWTGIDFDEVHLLPPPIYQDDFEVPSVSITRQAVPEPGSILLLAAGALAAAMRAKKNIAAM